MSAVTAKTADPSMEEILASIRRIIADDDDKAPEPGSASAETASRQDEPRRDEENRRGSDPVTRAEASPGDDGDDVLDLASVREQAALDTSLEIDLPDLSFHSVPEPAEAEETTQVSAPEAPSPVVEAAEPPAVPLAAVAPTRSEMPRPREVPRPVEEPAREAPPAATSSSAPKPGEAILSQSTTASVGQAFNLLSHTIMSQNAHTLEDVVREMLKPMLKTWLDDNLPPLVERLVAAEIQRVARGQR